jgi:hypothetical protein
MAWVLIICDSNNELMRITPTTTIGPRSYARRLARAARGLGLHHTEDLSPSGLPLRVIGEYQCVDLKTATKTADFWRKTLSAHRYPGPGGWFYLSSAVRAWLADEEAELDPPPTPDEVVLHP